MRNKYIIEELLKRGKPKVNAKKVDLQEMLIQTLLSGVVVLPTDEQADNTNKKKRGKRTLNEMDGLRPGLYWILFNPVPLPMGKLDNSHFFLHLMNQKYQRQRWGLPS